MAVKYDPILGKIRESDVSTGESNTASNVGSAGTGLFKQKAGVDLEFYKINSVNNLLTVGLDGTDKVDLTVNQGNISIPASQISDFDTEVSNNTDVSANTSARHSAVTLDVNADTLLSLSTQELGLDTQTANKIFSGPTTGAAAVPTFRSLVADDIPTLTAAKISDFDTEVSNNTDVAANTSARHSAVTLAGTPDYITITGQEITRNQIDLTADVTGVLPDANVADDITLTNITQITNRSHTNLSDIGTNTHAQIDTHIGSTANPHSVTYTQVGAIQDAADTVDDTHIDWGTGAGQVSAVDVPIADTGSYFTGTEVETALQELGASVSVVNSGSTVPTSPSTGEFFLHTPTGRMVLMMYDGSNWQSLHGYGTNVMYVDTSSGTDSINNGGSSGAGAFATVQYAIDQVPVSSAGDVTINQSGNSTEELVFNGKVFTGDYTLTLKGTPTQQTTGTVASGVQGSGATQGSVTVSGTPWSAGAYNGMAIRFDDATTTTALRGVERVIDVNTNNTATITAVFPAAPVSGDTFKIYSKGTQIKNVRMRPNQGSIVLEDLHILGGTLTEFGGTLAIKNEAGSQLTVYRCKISDRVFEGDPGGVVLFYDTYADAATLNIRFIQGAGRFRLFRTKVYMPYAAGICIQAGQNCSIDLREGCILDGGSSASYGIYANEAGAVNTFGDSTGYIRIRNCGTGAYAGRLSLITSTANNQYSGNSTADETADAASFGYID